MLYSPKRGDNMITYKMDVLSRLKEAGYSTYRLRKDKIFSEKTIQGFRKCELVSFASYDKLCQLLHCDIGDVLTHVEQLEIDNL